MTRTARAAAVVAAGSPLGPGGPSGPGGPGGPRGPGGPGGPSGPAGPGGPGGPSGPAGPGGPTGPGGPAAPCGPTEPCGPGSPCVPFGASPHAARNARSSPARTLREVRFMTSPQPSSYHCKARDRANSMHEAQAITLVVTRHGLIQPLLRSRIYPSGLERLPASGVDLTFATHLAASPRSECQIQNSTSNL
jgi:hypothetical protein